MIDFSEEGLSQTYATATVNQAFYEVAQAAVKAGLNRPRYEAVQAVTGIPWTAIGAIHCMESSFNFDEHLHNGDPLDARTIHVPEGRPLLGQPPFTWEQSAEDALSKVWKPESWTLGSLLHFLEMYNGLGYRKYEIYSPYLWSFTTAYTSGKFIEDGSFDPTAVSKQMGIVALFKAMEKNSVTLV